MKSDTPHPPARPVPAASVSWTMDGLAMEVARLRHENETLKRRLLETGTGLLGDHQVQRATLNLLEDAVAAREAAEREVIERERAEQDLAAELVSTTLLQQLASWFAREEGASTLYDQIVETAMEVMGADFGSMQLRDSQENVLRLLAWKNFHPDSAAYWETVDLNTGCTCGLALEAGERQIMTDVREFRSKIGAGTMAEFDRSGIRAVQSTPLVSRGGELLGMISTHWREAHEPDARELRFMDRLARQAADLLERQRQAEAVRESEQRFRTLTEAAPALIWFDDPEGNCRFANQEYLSFAGKTPEELDGEGWQMILHEEDAPGYLSDFAEAIRERRPFHHAVRALRHDGEWRWLESFARPHFGAGGEYLGHVGISPDITERRRHEERHAFLLKLSDALRPLTDVLAIKREAMRVIGEAMGVDRVLYGDVMADGNEVIVPDNHVRGDYPKMTGHFQANDFGTEDIDKLRAGDVLAIPDVEKAEGLNAAAKAAYRAFNIRASVSVPLVKDGRWVSNLALHQGEPRQWTRHEIEMLREAADRTWAAAGRAGVEDDLRASEEKYRNLFDQMDEGYCIIQMMYDESGRAVDFRYVVTNPAFSRHNGLVGAEGKTIREFAPDLEPKWFEIYDRVAVTGESLRFEEDSAALGRVFDLYAFRVGEPEERKVAVLFNDVTERKRTKDALHEASVRKDEFLAMLAHELRNPLAAIQSAGELLQRQDAGAQSRDKAVAILNRQVGHMVRQVDDLLDMSRISSGKIELRREVSEIAPVIRQAVDAVGPLCKTKGHELVVSVPVEPLCVDGDSVRLAQVVGNLLTNACKFTVKDGRIDLTVAQDSSEVVIRVRDNGIGIAAADLPRIFGIFAQIDRSLDSACDGLGLGLALVKKLVELHGGTVEAHSEGLGHGCEFVVRLPLMTGAVMTGPAKDAGAASDGTGAKHQRVMVVDDNRDVSSSLAMVLELMGYTVETVNDPFAAVPKAVAFHPEIILLDIGMPGLNGYEVAQGLREKGQNSLKLVALSGWGQEEDLCRSREAGFDAHLVKPVDMDALIRLFESLTGR